MVVLYVFGYNMCCFELVKNVFHGKLHYNSAIIVKKRTRKSALF